MVDFQKIFKIPKGVTAIVGSGGKTTLAHLLAKHLDGTVIFTTTTRIFPSTTLPNYVGSDEADLIGLLNRHKKICVGSTAPAGKLMQSVIPLHRLVSLADYVFVEADGSKGLPIKAHRPTEPVFPKETNHRILVVGATGFAQPISHVCHCSEIFTTLANCHESQPVTPLLLTSVIGQEGLADIIMVNQCTQPMQIDFAKYLAKSLPLPLVYGTLQPPDLTLANF